MFQWKIGKDSPEFGLGTGLISTSPLSNIKKGSYSKLTIHKWIHVTKNNAKVEIIMHIATLCTLGSKWIKSANNTKSDATTMHVNNIFDKELDKEIHLWKCWLKHVFISQSIDKFAIAENYDCPSILHKINRQLWKWII